MKLKRLLSSILALATIVSMLPMTALAAHEAGDKLGTDDYYNVISKKEWTLVPGAATETEMVLNNAAGTRRQVLHIIEADPSNPDISIVPAYYGIDKDLTKIENQSTGVLMDTADYYESNLGYNIVGGMNTDLTYASSAPRALVYNRQDLRIGTPTSSMLCVYEDENGEISCEVSAYSADVIDAGLADGTLLHAIPVSFGMVVKDGKLVNTKVVRESGDDAARSMVGVKEDGTLVICMNDGRGANNSEGLSGYEEGEIMLALGCKWAANCDGGGSSTFLSKRAGEETFTMRSDPCDGAPRATLHGIFIASNVGPTGELDVVNVESEYDYFAPTTTYEFGAEAIDTHGYEMDLPEEIEWALSDDTFGTIEEGVFVSNGTLGDVDVQVILNDEVVGSKTITVANPTTLNLSATSTVMPYSTADAVRSIKLPIVAMVGEENVYYDDAVFTIELSNEEAGTLDGFTFTATDDTSVYGTQVIMTYLPTNTELVYSIEFGRGSEVIFDFEDGDVSDWMGFDEAKQWSIENDVNNTLVGSDPLAGQYSDNVDGYTFLSTTENGGQVHSGENALAWTLDNTDADFAGWTYNVLFNVGETIVLRDVANGKKATTLGMWLYIPEGAAGLAFQSQLYAKTEDGRYSCKQDHFMFETVSGARKNLNSCTEADIPESRWVYASIDISVYDYLCMPVATDTSNSRSPSFIRTYVKPMVPAELTFYIDDITLDYSSAVDDRVLPSITAPKYGIEVDNAKALENGDVIDGYKIHQDGGIRFMATAEDNMALDITSGKIFIDGVEVPTAAGNSRGISTEQRYTLLPGAHTVVFEIKDEMGNLAKLSRTFTVVGDEKIWIDGHNDSGEKPEYDSIYYVDIKAADIASVEALSMTLNLQNANKWELEGVAAAAGFDVTCDYNEISGLLDVEIERNDAAVDTSAETIVSIPVRVWSWDGINHVTGAPYDAEEHFKGGYNPIVSIDCKVLAGEVTLKNEGTFAVGGAHQAETMLNDSVNPWHYHDAELTVLNREGSCTEDGYSGRTYCETCVSVIDWGEVTKAEGHKYVLVDGVLTCTCGDIKTLGTELIEIDGNTYYAIAGKLVSGWQLVDEDYYYFDPVTFAAVDGVQTLDDGYTYTFKDKVLVEGQLVKNNVGTRYRYAGKFVQNNWATVGGKEYFFQWNTYAVTGTRYLKLTNTNPYWYKFGADGALIEPITSTGLFYYGGETYYLEEGLSRNGLVLAEDGYYYYFSSSTFNAVKNKKYSISETNGLDIERGVYEFMADGKMKQGLIFEENGDVVFYDNAVPVYAGLVQDNEGNYYYINSTKKAVKDCEYAVSAAMANGLLPAGTYPFGADGKMKSGLTFEENGDIVFYEKGKTVYAGLVQDAEGNYYYINSTKKAVKDCTYNITAAKTNGLLPAGNYQIAGDGRIKVGLFREENGDIAFYENGKTVYAGLVQDAKGNYYYINSTKKAVKNCSYYVGAGAANGLLPAGTYQFAADGKLKIGLVTEENGDVVFYKDNKTVYAGLVQDAEGNYYYINSTKKAVKNCSYYIGEAMTNGLLPAGVYEFDAEGKMRLLNGIVEENGELYYYVNNTKTYAGLVLGEDGSYYYFNSTKKAVKNCQYYVGTEMSNGLLPAGTYTFDINGRMVR